MPVAAPLTALVTLADFSMVLTLTLDFSQGTPLTVDLSGMKVEGKVEGRTVYCDLSKSDSDLLLTDIKRDPAPHIVCRARNIGFYPCFFDAPMKLGIDFAGAAQYNPVKLQFYNRIIPGPVWQASS